MDFIKNAKRAIENNRIIDLLCGKQPYEVEVSRFTSDVFPTDVNAVLVNCIYNLKKEIEDINIIFIDALLKMISSKEPLKLYIAILYFDACTFQEERGKATFIIDKEYLSRKISEAVSDNKEQLEDEIIFYNGLTKRNAMNNIIKFNNYYEKKYGFKIIVVD